MDALTIFLIFLGIAGVVWLSAYLLDQNLIKKQAMKNGETINDIEEED